MKINSMNDIKIQNSRLVVLLTSAAYQQEFYSASELFFFLLQYSFLLKDNDKTQEACDLKTNHFLAPQGNGENGARYLDPKYSRWLSTDPALTSYVERNYDGPSGGIYNSVNLNLYHYGGNNPIKYVDPDGREEKCAYSQSLGNHDLLPTIDEVDTGCEPVDFTLAVLGSTYNLLAQGVNTLNNGIFSGFELLCKGIDWLDENWPTEFAFTGNGIKADFEMYSFVFGSNPQLVANFAENLALMPSYISSSKTAIIGDKLNYLFGKATGSYHNIVRSQSMERQLESIGLCDNSFSRSYITGHLNGVLKNQTNILEIQNNGIVVRESLLSGPDGVLKVKSFWDKNTLVTVELFGGM